VKRDNFIFFSNSSVYKTAKVSYLLLHSQYVEICYFNQSVWTNMAPYRYVQMLLDLWIGLYSDKHIIN
jgi:hypothetical protein